MRYTVEQINNKETKASRGSIFSGQSVSEISKEQGQQRTPLTAGERKLYHTPRSSKARLTDAQSLRKDRIAVRERKAGVEEPVKRPSELIGSSKEAETPKN